MTLMENAFYDLLNKQIQYDESIVPIIKGYAEIDSTPCITIQTADETFVKRRYVEIDNIQYIQKRYQTDVWINIWCNSNKQRISIIQQVQNRILQAEANHYSTCKNYNMQDKSCEVLNDTCKALTKNKHRAHKNQCPNLDIYTSFFKHYHIIKNTFSINSITDLDELNIHEPVLRSILKLKMNYYSYYKIGGEVYTQLEIDEELL